MASHVAPSDALSSVPKKASDFFLSQFGPDSVSKMREGMSGLGPKAILADVSPEMQMIARGAASRPGSRGPIVEALAARDAGKNARITEATNNAIGPVKEPSAIKAAIAEGKSAVGPQYDTALSSAKAVDTSALAGALDAQIVDARGPVRAALEQARSMLNLYGTKQLDPSPAALMETRKALDGLIGAADRSGDRSVMRALSMARNQVDETLGQAAPGVKAADAQYSELARQGNALEDGAKVFRSGPEAARPADLASGMSNSAVGPVGPSAVPIRMREGARAEIDRIVGSNANDVAAMRNLMKGEGDWNRAKLETLFGKDKAERILKALDSETTMESTFRTVVGGSQTAPTQGFKEFLDGASKGTNIPAEASGVGLAARGAKKLIERLTGTNNEAKAARFADDLGRLSISGGDDAQRLIDAIAKRQAKQSSNQSMTEAFGRIGAGSARADDPAGVKAAVAALLMGRELTRRTGDQAKERRQ